MTHILSGTQLSQILRQKIHQEISELKKNYRITPALAIVRVGEDPASKIYVQSKRLRAEEVGMIAKEYHFPTDLNADLLRDQILQLNDDPTVHGIIIQLPLPQHLNTREIINLINPLKDVDGLHTLNVGKLVCGEPGFIPSTPLGCLFLLRSYIADLTGLQALVIGRSLLVGQPMAHLLLHSNCTVTIAHSKTPNLKDISRHSDIVIVAIGKPRFVQAEWIKPGAIVIDVGINRLKDHTLVGDVNFQTASQVVGAITPVPGGVGPMTVACLLFNTVMACAQQNNISLSYLPAFPLKDTWWPS